MNDNFYSQSASRVKSERIKLSLNQAQAGDLCGVSREMWGKYERGDAVPGGEVLFAFAAAGADIQYILTGIPCIPVTTEAENAQPLPSRAKALLDNYLNTDDTGKRIIEATALAAAQSQPTVKKKRA